MMQGTTDALAKPDEFLDRLAKLVPADFLSIYIGLKSKTDDHLLGYLGAFTLGALLVHRCITTWKPKSGPQGWAILISAVSFTLWVYGSGGRLFSWEANADGKTILMWITTFFTFFAPSMYKGDTTLVRAPSTAGSTN